MSKKQIEEILPMGFYVDDYSPGDGVTRYRFFRKPSRYHGPESGIYTALGRKEALVFAQGVTLGFNDGWNRALHEVQT